MYERMFNDADGHSDTKYECMASPCAHCEHKQDESTTLRWAFILMAMIIVVTVILDEMQLSRPPQHDLAFNYADHANSSAAIATVVYSKTDT